MKPSFNMGSSTHPRSAYQIGFRRFIRTSVFLLVLSSAALLFADRNGAPLPLSARTNCSNDGAVGAPTRIRIDEHASAKELAIDQNETITAVPGPNSSSTTGSTSATMPIVRVEATDLIYGKQRLSPVIVEEYKLAFFDVPKVASSAWMLLFQRICGVDRSKLSRPNLLHNPGNNQLRYLFQYNLTYATHVMNDPAWTRATFTRNPHERLLSAYLDKGVGTKFRWIQSSCCRKTMDCIGGDDNRSTFDYFMEFVLAVTCP